MDKSIEMTPKDQDKDLDKDLKDASTSDIGKEKYKGVDQNSQPRGNMVFRQELISLTPECGLQCAIICNIALIIIFVGFGLPIIMFTNKINEYVLDYNTWYIY